MEDGISVDPPLRSESRKVFGSISRGLDSEREEDWNIGEVGERDVLMC